MHNEMGALIRIRSSHVETSIMMAQRQRMNAPRMRGLRQI